MFTMAEHTLLNILHMPHVSTCFASKDSTYVQRKKEEESVSVMIVFEQLLDGIKLFSENFVLVIASKMQRLKVHNQQKFDVSIEQHGTQSSPKIQVTHGGSLAWSLGVIQSRQDSWNV